MRIIKQYYLLPLISMLIVCSLSGLGIKSPNSFFYNLIAVVVLATIAAFLIGTILYFQDTRWGPAKRKKKLLKPPLINLIDYGFREIEDMMTGIIDGYTVFVYYSWDFDTRGIMIDTLFDPNSKGYLIQWEELDEIIKRQSKSGVMKKYEMEWTRNSVGTYMKYTFIAPKIEDVLQKASLLITMLKNENLKPFSFGENEKWMKQLEQEGLL